MNRKPTRSTVLAAAAVSALALSGTGVALAAGDSSPQGGAPTVAKKAGDGVIRCDGGPQRKVWNRIVNTPSTFGEGADFTPNGGTLFVYGPKFGRDTLSITFSGETNLTGSTDADERNDWMGVEVHVDGAPIEPYTAVGDVYALAGPGGYDSHAAQFCTQIGRGKHKVEVKLNLHDGGNNDNLRGWIDDHVLRVEKSH